MVCRVPSRSVSLPPLCLDFILLLLRPHPNPSIRPAAYCFDIRPPSIDLRSLFLHSSLCKMYFIHARTFDHPSSHHHKLHTTSFAFSFPRIAQHSLYFCFALYFFTLTSAHFPLSHQTSDFFPFLFLSHSLFKPSFLTFIDIHYIQHIHFILTSHCNKRISNYKLPIVNSTTLNILFHSSTLNSLLFVPTHILLSLHHFPVHRSSVLGTYFLFYSDNFPPPPFLLLPYICYCSQLATVWPDPLLLLFLIFLSSGFFLFLCRNFMFLVFFLRSRALPPTFSPIPHLTPHIVSFLPPCTRTSPL